MNLTQLAEELGLKLEVSVSTTADIVEYRIKRLPEGDHVVYSAREAQAFLLGYHASEPEVHARRRAHQKQSS